MQGGGARLRGKRVAGGTPPCLARPPAWRACTMDAGARRTLGRPCCRRLPWRVAGAMTTRAFIGGFGGPAPQTGQ